jgi:hypothetical protein
MIKILPEVIDAAVNAYAGTIWDADARPLDYRHAMTAAIAAALAAWPENTVEFRRDSYMGWDGNLLILPLPQEKQG